MFARIKNFLICFTILAVATVQVFGMRAGYVCGCTGKQSNVEHCEDGECHPHIHHEEASLVTEHGGEDDAEQHGLPGHQDHHHSELGESLVALGFPPVPALPPAVLVDVLPGFEFPDFLSLVALGVPLIERPDPPEYGSPPMPLLVAETIVMLV